MLTSVGRFLNRRNLNQIKDPRNLGLYIFALVVLAISWSGVKTIQNNYQLQKQISQLQQQNAVLTLQNENTQLRNRYYQTNQYLDLAARQALGLAAPGEQVMLVPRSAAMKYVDQSLASNSSADSSINNHSKYLKNLEAWRDFLLGRKISVD